MKLSDPTYGGAEIGAAAPDGPTFQSAMRDGNTNNCLLTYLLPLVLPTVATLYVISKPANEDKSDPFTGYTSEQVVAEAELTKELPVTMGGQPITVQITNDLERKAETEYNIAVLGYAPVVDPNAPVPNQNATDTSGKSKIALK